jgi:glycerol-3-phosphate dehydrogenase (NAD(P)+)
VQLRVAVLGAGSWGTTVATLACRNAPTTLWSRRAEAAREINDAHTNERYLPRTPLPRALNATDSIEQAVRDADLVVMGVPSHGVRATLDEVKKFLRPWVPLVSLAKGLERDSHLRMTQVIHDVIPDHVAGCRAPRWM